MTQATPVTTEQVWVATNLPSDLRLLTLTVLKGDLSAVAPFLDCAMENLKGGSRLTPTYVDELEDLLRSVRSLLMKTDRIDWVGRYSRVDSAEAATILSTYAKMETVARSLGRHGLS